MKTAVNAPLDDLNMNVGAMKLASVHLAMVSAEYRAYLRASDRYVIMDGSNEELGSQVDSEEMAELIEALKPHEVVLPYVTKNKEATYDAAMEFYNDYIVDMSYKPSIMAVAQGSTLDEWMESYTSWLELDFIDVIGVPKDIDFSTSNKSPSLETLGPVERRSYNRRNLVSQVYYSSRNKPIHLLEINNLGEVEILRDGGANKSGFIRSIGTTAPFSSAISGFDWSTLTSAEKHFETSFKPLDYDHVWDPETKARAYKNLMTLAESTGDHSISYNLGRISVQDEIIQPKENHE